MRKLIFAVFAALLFAACGNQEKEVAMIRPAYLQPGDTVGLMSVSSPMVHRPGQTDTLIEVVKSWGVNVKCGKNLFKHEATPFNVTDQERAQEFMEMINDPNIKAIVFYRGGYGAIRTLEYVDFEQVRKNLSSRADVRSAVLPRRECPATAIFVASTSPRDSR